MNKYMRLFCMISVMCVSFKQQISATEIYELDHDTIMAVKESYERTARIRYWQMRLGFVAKIAFDSATMYRILMPLWTPGVTESPSVTKPLSWGQWGRAHVHGMVHEMGTIALHMLVNQLASPLVQKLQDKVPVSVASSWFLTMFAPSGYVMLSQDLALFVRELETIDISLRTLLAYQGADSNYRQKIIKNISAMMERSLGYMYYARARLQERDKVASLTVQQVADSIELLTNEFNKHNETVTCVSDFRRAWQEQCALLRCMVAFQGERLSV
jgi:hypothetical protein